LAHPRIDGIGLVYAAAAIGLVLVVISLLGNLIGSFAEGGHIGSFTLQNYRELLADDRLPPVLARTLILGLGSVAALMVFALPITWLIARTDFPWKGWVFTLLTAKLAIPGFITAMAYIWLFNPTSGIINKMTGTTGIGATPAFNIYDLSWICFLQGLVLVPAAVFMMLPAFRNMDGTLEEAAWACGVSRFTTTLRIVVPLLGPGILAAGLFFFIVAIEIFDFVGLIGMPGGVEVLVTWIYDAMHPVAGRPAYGFAGAVGMLLFFICGLAVLFYIRLLRRSERYAVVGGKRRHIAPQRLGRWRWAALAFVGAWVMLAVVIPVVTLVWVALVPYLQPFSMKALNQMTLSNFAHALDYMAVPFRNTATVMVVAVVLSTVFSVSISWVVTRSRSGAARWADGLVFLAPTVPTIVAAVAFQYLGIITYTWLPLYGTIWLIAIVMATRMIAYSTRTINATSLQLAFELDEAAQTSGVSRLTTLWRIYLPIIMPAVFYSALMVGMLAARELTIPVMMNTGHAHTISTLVFDLQTNGDQNGAAAVSLYMIVVLVALAIGARYATGAGESDASASEGVRRPRSRPAWQPRRMAQKAAG